MIPWCSWGTQVSSYLCAERVIRQDAKHVYLPYYGHISSSVLPSGNSLLPATPASPSDPTNKASQASGGRCPHTPSLQILTWHPILGFQHNPNTFWPSIPNLGTEVCTGQLFLQGNPWALYCAVHQADQYSFGKDAQDSLYYLLPGRRKLKLTCQCFLSSSFKHWLNM